VAEAPDRRAAQGGGKGVIGCYRRGSAHFSLAISRIHGMGRYVMPRKPTIADGSHKPFGRPAVAVFESSFAFLKTQGQIRNEPAAFGGGGESEGVAPVREALLGESRRLRVRRRFTSYSPALSGNLATSPRRSPGLSGRSRSTKVYRWWRSKILIYSPFWIRFRNRPLQRHEYCYAPMWPKVAHVLMFIVGIRSEFEACAATA